MLLFVLLAANSAVEEADTAEQEEWNNIAFWTSEPTPHFLTKDKKNSGEEFHVGN